MEQGEGPRAARDCGHSGGELLHPLSASRRGARASRAVCARFRHADRTRAGSAAGGAREPHGAGRAHRGGPRRAACVLWVGEEGDRRADRRFPRQARDVSRVARGRRRARARARRARQGRGGAAQMIGILASVLFAWSAEENRAAPGLEPSPALVHRLPAAVAAKGPEFHPNTRHLDAHGRPLFTNRLILETSPYLLQHANNPVSWYAWGDEPFARAAHEHKPVLRSVGYSPCHWCHVMERESFEDLDVGRCLNANYVAIKVDREERPDVDGIYMAAVEMLTGNGGWPMTVALTPDRQPFFGGTYFPRERFLDMLQQLRRVYDKDPARVAKVAMDLSRAVQENAQPAQSSKLPGPDAIREAAERLARIYDPVHGGFGGAPKFPSPVNFELLLRYHR